MCVLTSIWALEPLVLACAFAFKFLFSVDALKLRRLRVKGGGGVVDKNVSLDSLDKLCVCV